MLDNLDLRVISRISIWGRVIGAIAFVYGIVTTVTGLFAYLIGAIPGIFTILIGRYLYLTGKEAKKILQGHGNREYNVKQILTHYSYLVMTIGIMIIIVVFFYIIFFSYLLFMT